ncbi:MAG TPA: endonuclease III [Candidatus Tectomicrobia bacterium]|nr:endonuclease III [Candidatus Tectomicrobia bacterium]
MARFDIHQAMATLRAKAPGWTETALTTVARTMGRDPFKILIGCLLSLRTKDETTGPAAARLFALAGTAEAMLQLSVEQIAQAIYPVGFYRTKAAAILDICRALVARHGGRVPDTMEGLLELKGVGRKTANLVLTLGFQKPAICVDTHVHRISNRWGYVRTKTPEATEFALRRKLPKAYWLIYNDLLVAFGQNICKPISPLCGQCPLSDSCAKVGVKQHR